MTEQEYIDATNLAKLRIIKVILYDCLPMVSEEDVFEKEVRLALMKWIRYLEPIVKITTT